MSKHVKPAAREPHVAHWPWLWYTWPLLKCLCPYASWKKLRLGGENFIPPHTWSSLSVAVGFYSTVGEPCCRMIWKLTNVGSGDKNAPISGRRTGDHPYCLFNSQAGQNGPGHATCTHKEVPLLACNWTLWLLQRWTRYAYNTASWWWPPHSSCLTSMPALPPPSISAWLCENLVRLHSGHWAGSCIWKALLLPGF